MVARPAQLLFFLFDGNSSTHCDPGPCFAFCFDFGGPHLPTLRHVALRFVGDPCIQFNKWVPGVATSRLSTFVGRFVHQVRGPFTRPRTKRTPRDFLTFTPFLPSGDALSALPVTRGPL